jgi:peptidoglycan hydrolase-like protein with peptidoglycan-binding domain
MKTLPLAFGALLVAATAGSSIAQAQSSWEVRDTQVRLQANGFYNGPIDGIWGPETSAALARYQQSRGTAYGGVEPARPVVVVPPVVAPPAVAPVVVPGVAPPTRPVALVVPTGVRTVQSQLRQLNFYAGPVDGIWGPGTQAAMENFQRSRGLQVGQIDTATLAAMGLDPAAFGAATPAAGDPLAPGVIRAVQQRLAQNGYYNGPVDGVWGPGTESSLAQFQRSREIEPSGHLTPATATALGLDPNNLSLSALPPH